MKVLFTKSNYALSKAIMDLTGEPVSHCALQVDDAVIESNLYGVLVTTYEDFTGEDGETVVFSVEVPTDYKKIINFIATYERSLYDFGALFFMGAALILHRLFGTPVPKTNLWRASNTFLCTELVTDYLSGTPDATITPYQLYLQLQAKTAAA